MAGAPSGRGSRFGRGRSGRTTSRAWPRFNRGLVGRTWIEFSDRGQANDRVSALVSSWLLPYLLSDPAGCLSSSKRFHHGIADSSSRPGGRVTSASARHTDPKQSSGQHPPVRLLSEFDPRRFGTSCVIACSELSADGCGAEAVPFPPRCHRTPTPSFQNHPKSDSPNRRRSTKPTTAPQPAWDLRRYGYLG